MMDKIRKFGLGYCDLHTLLWNTTTMFRLLSINIDKRNKKRIPIVFYLITIIAITSYCYVYIVSTAWYSFIYCRQTKDRLSAIINFSVGVASTIAFCKLVFVYLYEKKIRSIIAEYLVCDTFVTPGSRLDKNILKTMRYVKKRAIVFWIPMMLNGIIYALKPFLIPGRHFPEDDFILYGLNPMFESPNYEIATFLFTVSIGLTIYSCSTITAFVIIITGYVEAQMLALGEEISLIWDDAQEFYSSTKATRDNMPIEDEGDKNVLCNNYVRDSLKNIAKIHMINISLISQVETVFRIAIAVEFILLFVSLTAILLGGLENTYLELPYGLMQVAIDCYTGQRLIDASVFFENSVYFCKWENFDNRNMQTVLLMLQASQKYLTLSAGGLTTLSFPCLMSVLKSIYSTFTTLHSVL